MAGELAGRTVAIIGGDERVREIARLALAAGAAVRAHGAPRGIVEDLRGPQAPSVADAVAGADAIILPVPGFGPEDRIYAPHAPDPVFLTAEAARGARPGALLLSGDVTPTLRAMATAAGLRAHELNADDELAVLHAIPTAEGAARLAIENTPGTIHGSHVVVIGFGRIALAVANLFRAMMARVWVAARNPAQRARAELLGCTPLPLDRLGEVLGEMDVVINTVRTPMLTRDLLGKVRSDALVMDLASPPGGTDFEAGRELNLKVIWARAQAGSAPRRAGRDEWRVVLRILRAEGIATGSDA